MSEKGIVQIDPITGDATGSGNAKAFYDAYETAIGFLGLTGQKLIRLKFKVAEFCNLMARIIETDEQITKGNPGAKGDKGDKGDKGEMGERGPRGDKGDPGLRGTMGPQGIPGQDGGSGGSGEGPPGPQGEQGPVGPQGPKGDTGEQGIQGENGSPGEDGEAGEQGPKGDKGNIGDQGAQGIQGLTGQAGPKGDIGETGGIGPQGSKGDKGDTGDTGLQGIQGPKGDTGEQGSKGDKGETGPQGTQGTQGVQGVPGAKGDQGDQGVPGDKGDTGNQGQQGIPGSPGVDGEQGPAGQQGIQGEQGAPGPAPIWGNITGSIANQTDLSGAFSVVNVSINSKESKDNKGAASGYASLNSSGLVEQNPANATATPTPNKIAIADANGKLDGWITASGGGNGYALNVQAASQSTTTDSQTLYWGSMLVAPSTTAARWRVYIPKSGTIKAAYIYSYASTAGSNENWSMYIRKNNSSPTDTLIQTLGAATNDRVWSNAALSIAVVAGDYIEIKEVCPAWATNPATVTRAGVIYIE